MSALAGKLGIVFGVANKRSIAWAIAQAMLRLFATPKTSPIFAAKTSCVMNSA